MSAAKRVRKKLVPRKRRAAPTRTVAPEQRLLTLVATLLDAREPLPLEEIQRLLPEAYEGSVDAVTRKFERDKEMLIELGIPLRYVTGADEESSGYLVDRAQLFLPNLELSAEESATLFLAGSALLQQGEFPYRDDLERALEKIRLRTDTPGPSTAADRVLFHYPTLEGGADLPGRIDDIQRALDRRKTVSFVYRSGGDLDGARRRVDPYGLFCRRGHWLLVGYSHERSAIRVFAVQKITDLQVNAKTPRTPDFEVPKTFRLRDHVGLPPWRFPRHAAVTVDIEVEPAFVWLAEQELETAGVRTLQGWSRFRIEATHQDPLVEWLLGMGSKARVVSPEPLRRAVRERLDAVIALYEKPPQEDA